MKTKFLIIASILLISGAYAQERAAAGSVEVQTTWTTLKNLIDNANLAAEVQKARLDQSVLCGNKGMLYAPSHSSKDTDGCIQIGASRLTRVGSGSISFSSLTKSNATVSKVFAIPANSVQLMLTTKCSVKDQDAQIRGTLTFSGTIGYPADVLCDMLGVADKQTHVHEETKYIPIPKDATNFAITRSSTRGDLKRVDVTGIFLGE